MVLLLNPLHFVLVEVCSSVFCCVYNVCVCAFVFVSYDGGGGDDE